MPRLQLLTRRKLAAPALLLTAICLLAWFGVLPTKEPAVLVAKFRYSRSPDGLNCTSYGQVDNGLEDSELQAYISKHKFKVNGMIAYLANTQRVNKLVKSLNLLYRNFNFQYRYPVVIFHEASLLPKVKCLRQLGLISENESFIFFQQVNLSVPDSFLRKHGQPPVDTCSNRTVGYKNMCRFQAKLIFEQPILRHFDYLWRLDDDSDIAAKVSFDVFDVLKTGGFSYGFVISNIDDCAQGVFDASVNYMKVYNISPTFFHQLKQDEVFFNNFEVSSLEFWRSQQYRHFMDHIDSLGGIYLHRWGDAPIKTLALSMFLPLKKVHRYRNISYDHPFNEALTTKFLQ